jgi:hypothetical protein
MTDDLTPGGPPAEESPLDGTDLGLLTDVATMLDTVDPVPDDLVQRIQFALALDEVYDEVARMSRVHDDALAVRTELSDATRTETLTFSAERLTAMVTLSDAAPGRIRIDGWVSPPGVRRVGLRMQGLDGEVHTDESGRFVADAVREGFVQLVFHPLGPDDDGGLVVTPLFKL